MTAGHLRGGGVDGRKCHSTGHATISGDSGILKWQRPVSSLKCHGDMDIMDSKAGVEIKL